MVKSGIVFVKSSWNVSVAIAVAVSLVLSLYICEVDCRRFDKCATRDGRQGICVVKRYCREANKTSLVTCDGGVDTFCCPVPSPRSAVPIHIPQQPTFDHVQRPSTTTTTTTTRRPQRFHDRPTTTDGEYGRPDRYPSSDRVRSDSRERFRDENPRRTHPSHSSRDDDRRSQGHRPSYNDYEEDNPPDKTIMFPGSHENSGARPTVPACGVKPYDLFIAGGDESRQHEWPWMTAIFKRNQGPRPNTFLCGGSLINTRYVLSAAHCMVYNHVVQPASSFVVRLGSHYLNKGEDYTVSTVIVHQNHSGADLFNDIGLLRIASEVYITDKIAPICLPIEDLVPDSYVGRMAKVSGWGTSSYSSTGASKFLQHVAVPIVPNEECVAAYSRVREAAFLAMGSDHIICAGLREGGKDACLGDSGGPLMLKDENDRWIIVGIVSLGFKCAEPGFFGVYTRVTHYLSWIYANMKR